MKKMINKFKVKKLTSKSVIRLSGVGNKQHTGRPRNSEKNVLKYIKN